MKYLSVDIYFYDCLASYIWFKYIHKAVNHHQYLILEQFQHSPLKAHTISSYFPFFLLPNPWRLLIYFLSHEFAYFGHFMQMESYSMWLFVTGFFYLHNVSSFIHALARVST